MRFFRLFFLMLLTLSTSAGAHGGTLLVVNKSSNSISLLDADNYNVLAELPVGKGPHEVAVSPSGKQALVSNYGKMFFSKVTQPGSTLTLIDIPNRKVLKTIQLEPQSKPHGIVFLSENEALVTAQGLQALLWINTETGEVIHSLKIPAPGPHFLLLDDQQENVFVGSNESGNVTKVNLATKSIICSHIIGKSAEGLALTSANKGTQKLLITNGEEDSISVLDPVDLSELKKIKVKSGSMPVRIYTFAQGKYAVSINAKGGTADVIDLDTFELVNHYPTTNSSSWGSGKFFGGFCGFFPVPVSLLLREDGLTAYISNSWAGNIVLINLLTGKILERFTVGREPDGISFVKSP